MDLNLTFILSALLGIIVSWCIFGKEFNQKLWYVALTVLGVTLVSTLIVSTISLKYLDTEDVFVEQSKLIPLGSYDKVRDTTFKYTLNSKDIDTIVNYDKIPIYFVIKDGKLNVQTNYTSEGYVEKLDFNEFKVVKIDTASWFGIEKTQYRTSDNVWVSGISLPRKNTMKKLYLDKNRFNELQNVINTYNKKVSENLKASKNKK